MGLDLAALELLALALEETMVDFMVLVEAVAPMVVARMVFVGTTLVGMLVVIEVTMGCLGTEVKLGPEPEPDAGMPVSSVDGKTGEKIVRASAVVKDLDGVVGPVGELGLGSPDKASVVGNASCQPCQYCFILKSSTYRR